MIEDKVLFVEFLIVLLWVFLVVAKEHLSVLVLEDEELVFVKEEELAIVPAVEVEVFRQERVDVGGGQVGQGVAGVADLEVTQHSSEQDCQYLHNYWILCELFLHSVRQGRVHY